MQNQISNMKKELRDDMSQQNQELKNMMTSFLQINIASSSGSSSLPSNTAANPRSDLKAIPLPEMKLSLPELTPTQMILELADRSTTSPSGIAEDVFVKVGKFHFLADFVVVDYVVDPRVPLIIKRPFLRTARALIDVYGEELTLRVDDEAITFKVGQTLRYSYNDVEPVNRIDVFDVSCEEYAQEVLRFLDISTSGNPTLSLDPILSTSSPSLTPFKGGDFILEEIEACLTNDSIPPGIDDADFDPEGDIRLLEKYPPEFELKDLPSHLEYTFLEGTDKLPVIISKELKDEEKAPFKGTFQSANGFNDAIIHDMIEETLRSLYGRFLRLRGFLSLSYASPIRQNAKTVAKKTNLVSKWEK
ncbi:reverse transcriptase domain-containing protein [Tanacetum coccineum]